MGPGCPAEGKKLKCGHIVLSTALRNNIPAAGETAGRDPRKAAGRKAAGRRAQKEIIEFALLSAASFLILTLVTITFSRISGIVRESQISDSLGSLSQQTALAIAQADGLIQRDPTANFTIYMEFPRDVVGQPYEIRFSTDPDGSCKIVSSDAAGSCVRAMAAGKITYVPLRTSRPVDGTIFGSAEQRAAVTYNSNENLIRLTVG